MTTQVIFFSVNDNGAKLRKICDVAKDHLARGLSLLILVPDTAVHTFVDELLWRLPEESFLPHPSKLLMVDTQPHAEAAALFNLRPAPYTEKFYYKTIYELEDHTTPEKRQLSRHRFNAYRDIQNFSLASPLQNS